MKIALSQNKPVDLVGPIYGYNVSGQPICYSRIRNKPGRFCQNTMRMFPNGRCRVHGGGKNRGAPITVGLFSRRLPEYLKISYEESLQSVDIGNMRDSIALMDALIAEYLGGLARVPSINTISDVNYRLEGIIKELDEQELFKQARSLEWCLERLVEIRKSRSEEVEVRKAVRERAELVKIDSLRVEKTNKYMTAEQGMALLAAVVTIVSRNVTDPAILFHISKDIDALVNRGTSKEAVTIDTDRTSIDILPEHSST